ncbi:hypothetical protein PTI98_000950 [Pleurotus ostreatus]|nr:hypothetical protein PTI98_000950 [Pleurotus ostreatus]
MLFAHQDRLSLSSLPYRAIQPVDLTAQRIKTLPKTEVLAHAPGFSVIENLYWHNRTFYLVTDQPWRIPPIKLIASLSTDTRTPANGRVVAKIKSIRLQPVSPEVKESNQIGETISLEAAERQFGSAQVIEGPMIINNDDNFAAHCKFQPHSIVCT